MAGCILETTLGLRTAERGPTSGTAPRPRPAYACRRLSRVPHVRVPVSSPLQGRQRASPTFANTEPAARCRPRGALGGGSTGWRGFKTSTSTHRRHGMRWGWPFSLESAIQGASQWFPICCFVRRCPGRAVEGAKRYPMATYTSARRRTVTVDISKAVNHRESAFLAHGRHDRSTIRLEVYFFLATRANRIAGR